MQIGTNFSEKRVYRGIKHYDSLPLLSKDIHEYSDTVAAKNSYIMKNVLGNGTLNEPKLVISGSGIALTEPSVVSIDGDIALIQADSQLVSMNDIVSAGHTKGAVCIVGWYQHLNATDVVRGYGGVLNTSITNDLLDNPLNIQASTRYQFRWDVVLLAHDVVASTNKSVTFSHKVRDKDGTYLELVKNITTSSMNGDVRTLASSEHIPYATGPIYLVPILSYDYDGSNIVDAKAWKSRKPGSAGEFLVSETKPAGVYTAGSTWYNPLLKEFQYYVSGVGFVKPPAGKRAVRVVIGTSIAGWTASDCDYLCDGVDDHVEIQAAIDSLTNEDGHLNGEILILDGVYKLAASITHQGTCTFRLSGTGSSTILEWSVNEVSEGIYGCLHFICGDALLEISDLHVRNTSGPAINNIGGLYAECAKISIDKVKTESFPGTGIEVDANDFLSITNCECSGNKLSGITSYSNGGSLLGNYCHHNAVSGIGIAGSNTNVAGNLCCWNGYVVIDQEDILTTEAPGILIEAYDCTVTGNSCKNNSKYGIYLGGDYSLSVSGNLTYGSPVGIYVGCGSNSITGNTSDNCNIGIHISGEYTKNNSIVGNTVDKFMYNESDHSILADSTCSNNLISSNMILGKDVTNQGSGNTVINNKHSISSGSSTNQDTKVTSGTDSTSITTGALVVTGGIGATGRIYADQVHGAVWNDYAEFRVSGEEYLPGHCVCESLDGKLYKSNKRLQKGALLVSDTYGFAIGETDDAKCPIAVAGRVLAYTTKDASYYCIGDPVCADKNGRVSKMRWWEKILFSDRMIGTISNIPKEQEWRGIPVNGRVWIKVI